MTEDAGLLIYRWSLGQSVEYKELNHLTWYKRIKEGDKKYLRRKGFRVNYSRFKRKVYLSLIVYL